jgi:ribose transport system substrate-binding protein
VKVKSSSAFAFAAAVALGAGTLAACSSGSTSGAASTAASVAASASTAASSAATAAASGAAAAGCPDVVTAAQTAVQAAEAVDAPWDGPTTGPRIAAGKTLVYVAQTMQNPGVAGNAKGVEEAAAKAGWTVKVIDGQGTPAGQQAAMDQAVNLKPAGIVIGGFDPATVKAAVTKANDEKIPVIGWHAVGTAGPSPENGLYTNITTTVDDVSKISADWVIADSKGTGGVVIFTDSSIPFAEGKSQMIKAEVATCPSLELLSYSNIPIPDAAQRTPQEVSSLLNKFGDKWTYSIAINDLYYVPAAAALRSAGKAGDAAPFNVGAGDGSEDAFQRVRDGQYQSVTVPEPLVQQGWQIVDEFNRAFAGEAPSGYSAGVHVVTKANVGDTTSWDPQNGYRDVYTKIWNG